MRAVVKTVVEPATKSLLQRQAPSTGLGAWIGTQHFFLALSQLTTTFLTGLLVGADLRLLLCSIAVAQLALAVAVYALAYPNPPQPPPKMD